MLAATRRGRLDESHKLQTFYRDAEEEEMWVSEKAYSLQSTDYGHDLNSAMVLLNKHEAVEREMAKRDTHTRAVMKSGPERRGGAADTAMPRWHSALVWRWQHLS